MKLENFKELYSNSETDEMYGITKKHKAYDDITRYQIRILFDGLFIMTLNTLSYLLAYYKLVSNGVRLVIFLCAIATLIIRLTPAMINNIKLIIKAEHLKCDYFCNGVDLVRTACLNLSDPDKLSDFIISFIKADSEETKEEIKNNYATGIRIQMLEKAIEYRKDIIGELIDTKHVCILPTILVGYDREIYRVIEKMNTINEKFIKDITSDPNFINTFSKEENSCV